MNFNLILDTETKKAWESECGNYRINYYNSFPHLNDHYVRQNDGSMKFDGYKPKYYAQVLKDYGSHEVWSFAGRMGAHKSFESAAKECRSSVRRWKRYLKADNVEEARKLIEDSVVGMGQRHGRPARTNKTCKYLTYPPKWVEPLISRRLRKVLPGCGTVRGEKEAA